MKKNSLRSVFKPTKASQQPANLKLSEFHIINRIAFLTGTVLSAVLITLFSAGTSYVYAADLQGTQGAYPGETGGLSGTTYRDGRGGFGNGGGGESSPPNSNSNHRGGVPNNGVGGTGANSNGLNGSVNAAGGAGGNVGGTVINGNEVTITGGDGAKPGISTYSGAGGGGGGAGLYLGGTGEVSTHDGLTVQGGDGGEGGNINAVPNTLSAAGAGGGGGAGIVLDGATLTNVEGASVIGGTGGDIGISTVNQGTIRFLRGGAGAGGDGIAVVNGRLINYGTITGGDGVDSDLDDRQKSNGGSGIRGGDDVYIINAGTVSAGQSYDTDGVLPNAIDIVGNNATLELQSGSDIQGNAVAASSTTNSTLALGGSDNETLDAGEIGTKYQGFDNFLKTGDSTWDLTGSTTEVTPWTIEEGVLGISESGSLGDPSGDLTIDGGTLRTNDSFDMDNNIVLGSDNGTIDTQWNMNNINGVISGDGGLTKEGDGVLTLTQDNTYTGGTNIDNGRLIIGNGDTTGSVIGSINVNEDAELVYSRSDSYNVNDSITGGGDLTFVGDGEGILDTVLDLTGNVTIDYGSQLTLADDGDIGSAAEVVIDGTLNAENANSPDVNLSAISGGENGLIELGGNNLVITDGAGGDFAGVIDGTGDFTLESGEQTLSGENTYTGSTNIDNGTQLTLAGDGDISSSSEVVIDGTLNAEGANGPDVNLSAISGADTGRIELGDNNLVITDASDGDFAGVIDGTGGLTLESGTQTLSGDNTYTGVTDIDNGTLIIGNGGTTGSVAGDINVDEGGELVYNRSDSYDVNDSITGGGDLTFQGGGEGILDTVLDLTGSVSIDDGSQLTLVDDGDIGSAAEVVVDGTLNAEGANDDINLSSISGADTGRIELGDNNLVITDGAGGDFAGVIDGNGGLTLESGEQTLSGENTYTGNTNIDNGTQLNLAGDGSISDSAEVVVDGTLNAENANGPDVNLSAISGGEDGRIELGNNNLVITDASGGDFAGVIDGTGDLTLESGEQTLSGENTYTGATNIDNGSQLNLAGDGSISDSSEVVVDGTLNAEGANGPDVNLSAISGGEDGRIELGDNNLVITDGNGGDFAGVIDGTGDFTLESGEQTLSGENTYTGATNIDNGTQLNLAGDGSISDSAEVVVDGTLNAENANGPDVSLSGISGADTGSIELGDNNLVITDASDGDFAGVIDGTGGLTLESGTQTLSGDNTYTGGTQIDNGTLIIGNGGTTGSVIGGINVDEDGELVYNRSDSYDVNNPITGGGDLTFQGGGEGILDTVLDLTGDVTIDNGTQLTLVDDGDISSAAEVVVDGTLNAEGANGPDVNVAGISGADTGRIELGDNNLVITDASDGDFAGVIDGTGGLTLESGTQTLSGDNTYTGGTQIDNGTLIIGNGGTSGSVIGGINVDEGGELVYNRSDDYTVNNPITGGGSVGFEGGGEAVIDTVLDITGNISVDDGSRIKMIDEGDISSAAEVIVDGTLNAEGVNDPNVNFTSLSGADSGLIELGGNNLVITDGNGGDFAGVIDGTGGFTLESGTQTLSGDNTYTGITNIDDGTLFIGSGGTTGSVAGDINVDEGGELVYNRSDSYDVNDSITGGGNLSVQGGGEAVIDTVLDITGNIGVDDGSRIRIVDIGDISSAAEVVVDGTLNAEGAGGPDVNFTSLSGTNSGVIELGGNNLVITDGSGSDFAGVIGGTGGFTLESGTQVLSGENTYTGDTNINNGTLILGNGGTAGAGGGTTGIVAGSINIDENGELVYNHSGSYEVNDSITGSGNLIFQGFGEGIIDTVLDLTGNISVNEVSQIRIVDAGDISSAAEVVVDGLLNAEDANGPDVNFTSLSGADSGVVELGANNLVITDGNGGDFAGVIEGTGGLTLESGTQILSGENTYTGVTDIDNGAQLRLASAGDISSSAEVVVDGTLNAENASGPDIKFSHFSGADSGLVELGSNNLVIIDGAGNEFAGVIDGTGGLTVESGTQILSGSNTYTGPTYVYGPGELQLGNGTTPGSITSNVVLDGTLSGSGSFNDITNRGVISPGTDSSFGTLTVNGDYIGEDGRIILHEALADDSTEGDRLIITGDTSGSTSVQVINRGGSGGLTDDGIKIIEVGGTSDGEFTLEGDYKNNNGIDVIVTGAYAYHIEKEDDGSWHLHSTYAGKGSNPEYQIGIPLYGAGAAAIGQLNSGGFASFGDRFQSSDPDAVAVKNSEEHDIYIWARAKGEYSSYKMYGGENDASFRNRISGFQTGMDKRLAENRGNELYGSLWLDYTHGYTKTESTIAKGEVTTNGFGFGGSLTWFKNNGLYLDGQLKMTWYDTDFKANNIGKLASGVDSFGYAIKLEGGQKFSLNEKWSLTPQAQLIWSSIKMDDYTDLFGAHVEIPTQNTLTGRLGVAADYDGSRLLAAENIGAELKFGLIANLYQELKSGKDHVTVSDTRVKTGELDDTWGELGANVNYSWKDGKYGVYGKLSTSRSLENIGDNYIYSGMVGFRILL